MSPIYHKVSETGASLSFGISKTNNNIGMWTNLGWDTGGLAKNGLTVGFAASDREGSADAPLISIGAYEILGVFPPMRGQLQIFVSGSASISYIAEIKHYISNTDVTVGSLEPARMDYINVELRHSIGSALTYGFIGSGGVLKHVKASSGALLTLFMGVQYESRNTTIKMSNRALTARGKEKAWEAGAMIDLSPRLSVSGLIASAFGETDRRFSIGLTYYLWSYL